MNNLNLSNAGLSAADISWHTYSQYGSDNRQTLLGDFSQQGGKMNKQELIEYLQRSIGGFGRYHKLAGIIMISTLISCNLWVTALGFLLQTPKYDCVLSEDAPPNFECTQHQICEGSPYIISYVEDPSSL